MVGQDADDTWIVGGYGYVLRHGCVPPSPQDDCQTATVATAGAQVGWREGHARAYHRRVDEEGPAGWGAERDRGRRVDAMGGTRGVIGATVLVLLAVMLLGIAYTWLVGRVW